MAGSELPTAHDIILSLGEELPVGIWVARAPGGEEVYVNHTFQQIMGVGLQAVQAGAYAQPYGIYTRDGALYPESRMPFVRALVERRVVVADDITIHRPDGSKVDVRAFARPVGEPITHVIVAFFDVTREVEAERARAESERRLQHAQRLEAIGNLAAGIAHDFNNLIFGIKLIATDLAASETDPKRRAALVLIDEITERSATLTRSLLGFARRGKHRAMPVNLNDVVAAMSEMLTRTIGGATLGFELEAANRGCVIGDQSQLEQVILNLVVNARDALEDGSGRIVVRTTDAPLSATLGPCVQLEVLDDGAGIPPELRDRVFEPYFSTKNQGSEHGTGLGLATVFGIVESHRGAIEIDAGLDGRGTTMRILLPAARTAAEEPERPPPVEAPTGSGTILVIDDDPLVRSALCAAVDALGYEALAAAGGAEALELYASHRAGIRAVLLDMVMPGMNGRATYLGLRKLEPDVDVLLMSGYTMNEEVQAILDLGVRAFLSKPYTVEALAQALAALRPSR